MTRSPGALMTVVLVVAVAGVGPAAGLHVDGPTAQTSPVGDAQSPGARLIGVVGVGQAELEGELRTRALGLALAAAGSDDARAAIVATQLERTRDRLDSLEARKTALQGSHGNGTLSESGYRARIATLAAEARATERVLNRTDAAAAALPEAALTAHGVDPAAVEKLRDRAADLRGHEVAEIARSIAGPGAGSAVVGPIPPAAPDVPGPPDETRPDPAENATATDG